MSLFDDVAFAAEEGSLGTEKPALFTVKPLKDRKILSPLDSSDYKTVPAVNLSYSGDYGKINQQLIMNLASEIDPVLLEVLSAILLKKRNDDDGEYHRLSLLKQFLAFDSDKEKDVREIENDWYYEEETKILWGNEPGLGHIPVVRGDYAHIFDFITTKRPKDFTDVVKALYRVGYYGGCQDQGWQELLNHFRQERKISKSMDKATKLSQMNYLDSDKQLERFSDMLCYKADRVFLSPINSTIKPYSLELVNGENMECTHSTKNVPPGKLLIGTTVLGDYEGASANDSILLKQIWEYSLANEDVPNLIEVYMDEEIPTYLRGDIINKGRPHNLTCVVHINKDGRCLRNLFRELAEQVVAKNYERNHRFYIPTEPKLLELKNPPEYWCRLKADNIAVLDPDEAKVKKRKMDPENHKREKRQTNLDKICMDKNSLRRCKIEQWPIFYGSSYYGPIKFNDIGFGTAEMVFASAVAFAEGRCASGVNYKVEFSKRDGWCIRPPDYDTEI